MPLKISDVASAAGVSPATVDRALNDRPGVHARTRARVMQIAASLGYLPETALAGPPDPLPRPVRLAFVVPRGDNTFLADLASLLQTQADGDPTLRIGIHRLDIFRPAALAAALRDIAGEADGLGVVATDHPAVREAIRDIARRIPVATLVSDIADIPRAAYIGIDNRAAGRLAGHLTGRFLGATRGEVALFAGSLGYRGHEEREMGFRRACAEDRPDLVVLPAVETEDDGQRAHAACRDLLARLPSLVAVYGIGGGLRGIAQALAESGRRLVFIGHELTAHTRRFLIDGVMDAVLDQDAATEASIAVRLLARAARGERPAAPSLLRVHAIFRENIPLAAIQGDTS